GRARHADGRHRRLRLRDHPARGGAGHSGCGRSTPRVSRLACFFLLATLFVGGCREAPAPEGKPLVVASFYPMWEFTRQVALDRAQVISLVPPGVAGHDWEPSPQDVAQVRRARVFVYNGAGFEPWAEKLIKEAAGPSTVVVAASAGLTVPRAGGEGGMDPHVWLDPLLAQRLVEVIRAALERGDPAAKAAFTADAGASTAQLG